MEKILLKLIDLTGKWDAQIKRLDEEYKDAGWGPEMDCVNTERDVLRDCVKDLEKIISENS
jgi:hypothetical protein